MNKISQNNDLARQSFVRYRRIATGLLVVMGIFSFFGYLLPYYGILKNNFLLSLFRAGAQAGFIGGCADWFAITALFRHPMGIPIPHTAILPKQQNRIAKGLGAFVAYHVFTEKDVHSTLNKIDFPSVIAKYIKDPNNVELLSQCLLNSIPSILDRFEDGRASAMISRIFTRLFSGESVTPLVVKALRTMVENDKHQEVVSFLLEIIKKNLKEKEENFRGIIQTRVREQGGRLVGWMVGGSIASKVLDAVSKEMDRIDPQDSELRLTIAKWINKEIDQMETNPEGGEKISDALKTFIEHESVKEWRGDIWIKIRGAIEEDLQKEDGWIKNIIRDVILYFSKQLETDPILQQKINMTFHNSITKSLPHTQEWIVNFTEGVVSKWDDSLLISRLENRVGKDLQYIRINGSIVGFIIGILLFSLSYICFGQSS